MSPEVWRIARLAGSAAALGLLTWGWVRAVADTYPAAWRRSLPRRAALAIPVAWWASMVAALIAVPLGLRTAAVLATTLSGLLAVTVAFTFPLLLVARAARRWARGPEARAPSPPAGPTADTDRAAETDRAMDTGEALTRRALIVRTAAAGPLGGVVMAGVGATSGMASAELVELELRYPDLPPALEGLRILQYSDVHLGAFIGLEEIEALVTLGKKGAPDLVVLTGDIADDLDRLPAALDTFSDLRPRLGTFASIGNHEYFRGLGHTVRAYERSTIPLLLEAGTVLRVGDAALHLGGADDPRYLARQRPEFFERTVEKVLDGSPSDAFRVLMSHRPEGFDPAARAGVHLTLAGHTHGAQLGVRGRSILDRALPDSYLWGHYARGASRLYTTSGAGHWFPFRIGCPREVAVLVLRRGPAGGEPAKRRIA